MKNRNGWWKFHRKMWENPYSNNPSYLSVWCWILSEAQYQEGKQILFNRKIITLKSGQLTSGAYQIAKATGVPRGTVERIIKTFKNEERIEVRTDHQKSLITVKKWKEYQENEEENEERPRNDRGTSEERVRTTEEVKELKNIKKERNIIISEQARSSINPIIELFNSVNPNYKTFYSNNSQRAALERMLKEFGVDKLSATIQVLQKYIYKPYAPKITSPIELEKNLGKLIAFAKSENNSNKVIKI